MNRLVAILFVIFLGWTEATPQSAPMGDFVIGAGDVLQISVWREPELTRKVIVRPDGRIGLSLLGDVEASGLTVPELTRRLTDAFAKLVTEPAVSIVVVEIHSLAVHVIGSVGRPGAYELGGPITVVELLARAGGITDAAKGREIVIVRTEGEKTRRFRFDYVSFIDGKNLQQNIPLRSGDVIIVP